MESPKSRTMVTYMVGQQQWIATAETNFEINGDSTTVCTGSVLVTGHVGEKLILDARMFAMGRNTSLLVAGRVTGSVELCCHKDTYRPLLFDVKINEASTVVGDVRIEDLSQGHAIFETTITGDLDCGLHITCQGETGFQHTNIQVTGPHPENVACAGLPARVTKSRDGTLKITLSAEFDADVLKAVRDEQIVNEISKLGLGPDAHR